MAPKPVILLIEDEAAIADAVVYALRTDGFEPLWCATGEAGLDAFRARLPSLVILDIGLPDTDGFAVFRALRAHSEVPVIFLTARSTEVERVVGLELGADDYVVKPFSPRELTARVKAVLRRGARTGGGPPPDDSVFPFAVDEQGCRIRFQGRLLELSRYEYRLLKTLLRYPGRVYSRGQLMDLAWEEPEHSLERTVDTHIKTLRAKLRVIDPGADPIQTHRGMGYSLRLSR